MLSRMRSATLAAPSPLQLCSADTLRVPLITLAAYLLLAELPPAELWLPGLWVLCGVVITSLPTTVGRKLRPEQAERG